MPEYAGNLYAHLVKAVNTMFVHESIVWSIRLREKASK